MNTNNPERSYLQDQLRTATFVKRDALQKQFHVYDKTYPTTYKELIDWIKNDKFTLDTKITARIDAVVGDDETYYGSNLDGIIWNGRGFTNDWVGYHAAEAERVNQQKIAERVIMTSDAAAGLKALQDFEAWTYTAPAVAPAA